MEVLTPDFKGKRWCIKIVADARPEIYNHNIETIERLHTVVRPQAKYERSLGLLRTVKELDSRIYTKSGIMVGLGETKDEVVKTLGDLREAGVDAVTIGQYLRPTMKHLPVVEYIHPTVFQEYEKIGEEMGFAFVASGPFIRSSYNAIEFSKKVMAERVAKLDAQGNYLWVTQLGDRGTNNGTEYVYEATVDGAGNVFVAGTFDGDIFLGTNHFLAVSQISDYFNFFIITRSAL